MFDMKKDPEASGFKPIRVYWCNCGSWHLSDKETIEKGEIRECPTPQKQGHGTRTAAEHLLSKIWRQTGPGKLPTYVYQCECSKWHLTSGDPGPQT